MRHTWYKLLYNCKSLRVIYMIIWSLILFLDYLSLKSNSTYMYKYIYTPMMTSVYLLFFFTKKNLSLQDTILNCIPIPPEWFCRRNDHIRILDLLKRRRAKLIYIRLIKDWICYRLWEKFVLRVTKLYNSTSNAFKLIHIRINFRVI